MKQETSKALISYYKWVVSLSIFVVSFSISLVSAVDSLKFSSMLKWGIALLFISIFFNWLTVKRLVSYLVIGEEESSGKLVQSFMRTMQNLKLYGLLQNWFFIIGLILIFLSFLLRENSISAAEKLLRGLQ